MLLNINDYGDVERDTFGFESFYEVKSDFSSLGFMLP